MSDQRCFVRIHFEAYCESFDWEATLNWNGDGDEWVLNGLLMAKGK
jgi:hypothetical protein